MVFSSDHILLIATEKTGGLFDFDGTLPVVALQFLIFMFILNFILYTPLLNTIDERSLYMKTSLAEASEILKKSNSINEKYEKKASKARNAAKLDLITYQKLYKDILEEKMGSLQTSINQFLLQTTTDFENNKENLLGSFENEIESLSSQIVSKIIA